MIFIFSNKYFGDEFLFPNGAILPKSLRNLSFTKLNEFLDKPISFIIF